MQFGCGRGVVVGGTTSIVGYFFPAMWRIVQLCLIGDCGFRFGTTDVDMIFSSKKQILRANVFS